MELGASRFHRDGDSERLIAAIASNANLTIAQIEERFRSAIFMGVRGHPGDVSSLVLSGIPREPLRDQRRIHRRWRLVWSIKAAG
jgi:hypothetical protein